MSLMRLDKYLADLGLESRSEIKKWIRAGRVAVDGAAVTVPEHKLDPESAAVSLDGAPLRYRRFHYYMMNKPEGVLTATEDRTKQTVLDLVSPEMRRMGLFPVGRLDRDTSGLLLLTDDGTFAHRVISPKSDVEKRYDASIEGRVSSEDIAAFAAGLRLGDGTLCKSAGLEDLGEGHCIVTVTEGKYHQVKRMLASRGKPVVHLHRLSIGALVLPDTLGPGEYVELDEEALCKVIMLS